MTTIEKLQMNVNQTNSDFVAIKNKIIEKGVEVADGTRTAEYAGKVDEVYEAGYQKGKIAGGDIEIDESKIIEKTTEGTHIVAIDDVSVIPHDISVQLSSDTITDFSGMEVKVYGKTLFDNDVNKIKQSSFITTTGATKNYYGYEIELPIGTYVIRTVLKEGQKGGYIYGWVVDADGYSVLKATTFVESNTNGGTRPIAFEIKDGYRLIIYDAVAGSVSQAQTNFRKYNIQIECDIQTSFEEYISPVTYTADASGKIEGIKSISPNMTFVCEGVDLSVSYRADWGIVTTRTRTWNGVTGNNGRATYYYTFSATYCDEIFYPVTDLVLPQGEQTFRSAEITNLSGCFKRYGTKLDTSSATTLAYCFTGTRANIIPEISLVGISSASGLAYTFAQGTGLWKIENLIFKEDGTTPIHSSMFQGASGLVELRVSGVIGQTGLNLSACTLLSKESIESIITHLSTTTSGLGVTFSKTAVNTAFETSKGANDGSTSAEWNTLIGARSNWTINLS